MALRRLGLINITANAGFRGSRAELEISCRLLQVVMHIARSFAEEILEDDEIDVPRVIKWNWT